MNEREREEIALFRYGVISNFIQWKLNWGERQQLLESVVGRELQHPSGQLCRVSPSTIKHWVRAYRQGGVDQLKPKTRKDKGQARTVSPQLQKVFTELRQQHPSWGVPELVRQARDSGLVTEQEEISLSTLYRLVGRGAPEQPPQTDRRRYSFEQLLECVQADVMYGPFVTDQEGKKHRSYLHAIMDDCSRLVLAGEFHLSERVGAFEQVLKQALSRREYVPERLYTDNGAAFVSHHIQWVCAQLGVTLLHSRPGVPEGRGKIERFFRTVREQFLAPKWRDGMNLEQLNAAFWEWVELGYHRNAHRGLEGKSPLEVWVGQAAQLVRRPRVNSDRLESVFRHRALRLVSRDRVVRLEGQTFQAPVEVIGEKVELLYNPSDLSQVEVLLKGKSFGQLQPLRPEVNRHVRRGIRFDKQG
jgi:putative transposase